MLEEGKKKAKDMGVSETSMNDINQILSLCVQTQKSFPFLIKLLMPIQSLLD
jgi:ABC-type methionine transport system permease subunit